MEEFHGFRQETLSFCGRKAVVVFPDKAEEKRRWLLKTEYFGAFPNLEEEMLRRGFHLAYLENRNRWGLDEDEHDKAKFVEFVSETYGLAPTCVPVGMSCGGLHAIDLAALHPETISALYLDAPVLNLLSCGGGVGRSIADADTKAEMLNALNMTMSELISFRKHPMDRLDVLVQHRIPVCLIYGKADQLVPYEENGIHLEKAYAGTGIPLMLVGKEGCDHHPHGLTDPTPIADFIVKYA